jgi:Holliday junction resolvase RusA-like endonuclease
VRIQFFVPGIPKPGGSKRAFINRKTGRPIITEDCKSSRDWRTAVAFAANEQFEYPFAGPLSVHFDFLFLRPRGHFGTGRSAEYLKKSAPIYPAVRPDTTKLIRSTEDALKGIAWKDDAQVVTQSACKRYAQRGGAIITVYEIYSH